LGKVAGDRASAEVLKDSLVDLRDNPAYRLVQDRLEALLSQSRRRLETAGALPDFRYEQGMIAGLQIAVDMIPTLLLEVEQTNWEMIDHAPS
jgi:hypothetical protein